MREAVAPLRRGRFSCRTRVLSGLSHGLLLLLSVVVDCGCFPASQAKPQNGVHIIYPWLATFDVTILDEMFVKNLEGVTHERLRTAVAVAVQLSTVGRGGWGGWKGVHGLGLEDWRGLEGGWLRFVMVNYYNSSSTSIQTNILVVNRVS